MLEGACLLAASDARLYVRVYTRVNTETLMKLGTFGRNRW